MSSGGGCGLQIRQRGETSLVSSILTRLRHFFCESTRRARLRMKQEAIICFESVSKAIMAEQALVEKKFSVRVMPTPSAIKGGCGFCLRFLYEDFSLAAAFLLEQGFNDMESYFREETDGDVSYKKTV